MPPNDETTTHITDVNPLEYWLEELAEARARFDATGTVESKQAYLAALKKFADLAVRGSGARTVPALRCNVETFGPDKAETASLLNQARPDSRIT